jgi:hypothetical protein
MRAVSDRFQFVLVWILSSIVYLPALLVLDSVLFPGANVVYYSDTFLPAVLYTFCFLSVAVACYVVGWVLFDWEWTIRQYVAFSLLFAAPIPYFWMIFMTHRYTFALLSVFITLYGVSGALASYAFQADSSSGRARLHSDSIQTLAVSGIVLLIISLVFLVGRGLPAPFGGLDNVSGILFKPDLLHVAFSLGLGGFVVLFWHLFDWDGTRKRTVAITAIPYAGAVMLIPLIALDEVPILYPASGVGLVVLLGGALVFEGPSPDGTQQSSEPEKSGPPEQTPRQSTTGRRPESNTGDRSNTAQDRTVGTETTDETPGQPSGERPAIASHEGGEQRPDPSNTGQDRFGRPERSDSAASVDADLDGIEAHLADGRLEAATERFGDLRNRLSPGGESTAGTPHGRTTLDTSGLDREQLRRFAAVVDRLDERGGPPSDVPAVPEVSVAYESLGGKERIGTGGNADVFRVQAATSDGETTLALKEPRIQGTLHGDELERFLDEAETWDKLDDHDHVVGLVDYGNAPLPWIAMEYMDGGHLGERAGELSVQQALWTATAITRAVRHAHRQGVAHLDLKPENVLFRSVSDAWDLPKVADWGLSKHLLEHSKSVEGLSPQYAAPEQFDSSYGSTDDVTDVYQLGTVLYELFTGGPPFEGEAARVMHRTLEEQPVPPSEVADVPSRLDEILLKALAKEKADRYESVLYLRDDLLELYVRERVAGFDGAHSSNTGH